MTHRKKSLNLSPCPPDYFLSHTARCGGAQPAGRWWNLAELFGISNGSEVDPQALLHLANGRSPDGGHVLADVGPHDCVELNFHADPSVALLWFSLDPERRAVVEHCHLEAVARALQAVEWLHCAYQEPRYSRFLPTPADIIGVLFQHTHTDPEPDLHTHCLVLGPVRARCAQSWGRLHRSAFADQLSLGATVYQQLLMRALRRRLGVSFETYSYDEAGAHYRVLGKPLEWWFCCGDPTASNLALRPLFGAF